ncbi:MAG: archaeal heat shock protein Hsp20 [Candidatus Micrarchaeota archaeon]
MAKKRRFPGFGEGFFTDFSDLENVLDDLLADFHELHGSPLVYGFSARPGEEGPVIQEFGNVDVRRKKLSQEREPLVDVIDEKTQVRAVIELPGVEKNEIKLSATPRQLEVRVANPSRQYAKKIPLPAEVLEDSAKAAYKNGILEVVLQKKQPTQAKPAAVAVK